MSRRVTYAKLHQGLFIPGVGDIGSTLPSQSKSFNSFSMASTSEGLSILINEKVEVLVPTPNVVLMVLAPESDTKKSK